MDIVKQLATRRGERAYAPTAAFLGGACDVFLALPFFSGRCAAMIGWPNGPGLGEAALRRAIDGVGEAASRGGDITAAADYGDRLLDRAHRRDDFRLRHASRLSLAGQCCAFAFAVTAVVVAGMLALVGHDYVALTPLVVLVAVEMAAARWLARTGFWNLG